MQIFQKEGVPRFDHTEEDKLFTLRVANDEYLEMISVGNDAADNKDGDGNGSRLSHLSTHINAWAMSFFAHAYQSSTAETGS